MIFKGLKKQGLKYYFENHGILIVFFSIIIFLSLYTPRFLTVSNIVNIFRQVSCIGIATIAVGILIIMNCTDLSIGSMFALNGVIACIAISNSYLGYGLPAIWGYVIAISVGVLFGLINGLFVAKGKIPAFIVTMGTQSIARGLALTFARGQSVGSLPDEFIYLGTSYIDPWKIVPWLVVFFIMVAVSMNFVLEKTPFGRHIYAIGGNEEAAKVAGINVDNTK
ncbi:MAG: ABC transporter permease, partial [Butyrivibrio sp.]|nr:ABC transporter permease [Butyrivibrio sp.]